MMSKSLELSMNMVMKMGCLGVKFKLVFVVLMMLDLPWGILNEINGEICLEYGSTNVMGMVTSGSNG